MLNLEEMETHSVLMDALDLAEKAGKSMQRDMNSYEELFERIDEQKSAQEQISNFIMQQSKLDISEMDESALLEELNELEAGNVEDQLNNSQMQSRLQKQRLD